MKQLSRNSSFFVTMAMCLLLLGSLALARADAQTINVDPARGDVAVHVPTGYDPGSPTPTPLVILLHGYGARGAVQEGYMQFAPLADSYGFLYLHPDGTTDPNGKRFWNATDACCNFFGSTVDDSGYLLDLINEMKVQYNVDADRVYLIGHSNGGFMAHRMACDHAGVIAAIVSLAGAIYDNPAVCSPTSPVRVLQIHGTDDETILYEGGDILGVPYPGAVETVEQWAASNGCSLTAETLPVQFDLASDVDGAETVLTHYNSECNTGGSAELWTIIGGSHVPALSSTFSTNVMNWLFAQEVVCLVTDDFEDAAASLAFWYDGNGDGGTEFNLNNSVVVDSADPSNSVYLVAPADGPSGGFALIDDNPAADWARLHVIDEFTIRTSLRTAGVDSTFPDDNYFGVFWGLGGVNITGHCVAVLNSTFQLTALVKIVDGVIITLLDAPFTVIEGAWYEMEIISTDTDLTFRVGLKGGPLTTIGTVPHDNDGRVVGTTGVFANSRMSAEFDDFALCANDVIADVGREGVETGFTDPSVLSDFTVLNGVFTFEDITPGDPALLGIADTFADPILEEVASLAAKGGASFFTDELVVSAVMQAKGGTQFEPILLDFDTPATGSNLSVVGGMSFTDAGVTNIGSPFFNVLFNNGSPAFTVEFSVAVDSLSFSAIGGSAATGFNAEVRDESGGLLDSFSAGPQGGAVVVLNGPGIRSLTISDGGFDTAIDNLFIDFATPPPGRDMGLFWGGTLQPDGNTDDLYFVEIEAEEQRVTFGEINNGAAQSGVSVPTTVEEFTWYDLAVVSKQGLIQIWLDGAMIIEFDDSASPIPQGVAGLYTEGAANFDNFSLLAKRVPTPGGVNIDPDVVNLKSHGNYLTAYIEVPAGFDVANIDLGTVLLGGVIAAESSPTAIGDDDNDGIPDLMVKFDRQAAIANIPLAVGDQTLDVIWLMTDGTPFIGQDTVKVIKPGKN